MKALYFTAAVFFATHAYAEPRIIYTKPAPAPIVKNGVTHYPTEIPIRKTGGVRTVFLPADIIEKYHTGERVQLEGEKRKGKPKIDAMGYLFDRSIYEEQMRMYRHKQKQAASNAVRAEREANRYHSVAMPPPESDGYRISNALGTVYCGARGCWR